MRYLTPPLLLIALIAAAARAEDPIRIEVRVAVPPGTEGDVYLAGDRPELGGWKPDGVKMSRTGGDRYACTLSLPKGTAIEFKFTRGTWATVEKGSGGEEVPNRRAGVDRDGTVIETKVERWSSGGPATKASTRTGDIRVHDGLESKILGNRRRVWVYLPPGYGSSQDRYPVLYMHDGQNVFDNATSNAGEWQADEAAEQLIRAGKIHPLIIVAIDNAGDARLDEYGPTREALVSHGGRADDYARFLIQEVKPFIDRTYRTRAGRNDTAIAGSSVGGLFSLYMARRHPAVFSKFGVVSPSLWWDRMNLLRQLQSDTAWTRDARFWVDMGTKEAPAPATTALTRQLVKTLADAGLKEGEGFRYVEAEGKGHNEAAWAERFPPMLLFFYGK